MVVRPFDPRLAREVQPVRGLIGLTTILSFCAAILFVVQSIFLARTIAAIFLQHSSLQSQSTTILLAASAWVGRVLLTNINEWQARTKGLRSVAVAREKSLHQLASMSPHQIAMPQGSLATLLTRGIDGLEIYVSRYLPQLVISAFVPALLGAVILWLDPLSALILIVTIPLIPLFMALVGWFTQSSVQKHWVEMNRLSGTLADLMNGLPELKVFGRARGLESEVRELGEQQKTATMKVLKLSFLSAFVLELLATISVALIAVGIGVRLVNGEMDLWRGLAALIIAPEVYAPLRMLGVHFHAASEGMEAWNQVKEILTVEGPQHGSVIPSKSVAVKWTDLKIQFGQKTLDIPDGSAEPGQITVIAGPSGCGKSSLLSVLIGTFSHYQGNVTFTDTTTSFRPSDISLSALPNVFGFVGQNAWLGEGNLSQIVGPDAALLREQLRVDLPLETIISDRDQGVSVGQRRRIAVARELARKPSILILDEPAAALDEDSERALLETLQMYARSGHTVIVVAHRHSLIEHANKVISFEMVAS